MTFMGLFEMHLHCAWSSQAPSQLWCQGEGALFLASPSHENYVPLPHTFCWLQARMQLISLVLIDDDDFCDYTTTTNNYYYYTY